MDRARRQFLRLCTAAAAASLGRAAGAETLPGTWPARPVRLIAGTTPGSGGELIARVLADRLSALWGLSVTVDSDPTASRTAALDIAAHAAPDGYTMLLAAGPLAVYRMLFPATTADAVNFAPVSSVGVFPVMIAVAVSSPFGTLADLLAYAKRYPGKIGWASPGSGSLPHLAGELFKRMAGVEMNHIAYDGVGDELMDDLASGRVDLTFNTASALLPAVRSHALHALAVTRGRRMPGEPNIPTVAESGLPGYDVSSWYGLYVPASTAADIVQRINTDVVLMLRDPAMKQHFQSLGVSVQTSRPDELADRNSRGIALWAPLITAANIRG